MSKPKKCLFNEVKVVLADFCACHFFFTKCQMTTQWLSLNIRFFYIIYIIYLEIFFLLKIKHIQGISFKINKFLYPIKIGSDKTWTLSSFDISWRIYQEERFSFGVTFAVNSSNMKSLNIANLLKIMKLKLWGKYVFHRSIFKNNLITNLVINHRVVWNCYTRAG